MANVITKTGPTIVTNVYIEQSTKVTDSKSSIDPVIVATRAIANSALNSSQAEVPDSSSKSGRNAMHEAACCGEIEKVKLLSKDKQLVDSRDNNGCTPLILAAQWYYPEQFATCEVLIKAGANPLAANDNGLTAMHCALTRLGNVKVVKMLSAYQVLIDSKDKNGSTPLMYAVANGLLEECEILLKAGVDPYVTDQYGESAIHCAIRNKYTVDRINKVVRMLLAYRHPFEREKWHSSYCSSKLWLF